MVCCFGAIAAAQDTTAPHPVDTLVVDPNGNGTTVNLDWTGYDESVEGDIDYYRIYVESGDFLDVSMLNVHATVAAGTFAYTVKSLTAGTIYYFAVIAVDTSGNANSTVSETVSGIPADTQPPEDVTNLRAESFEDKLSFTWDHSADSGGDLAGYRVYFDDDTAGVFLSSDQNVYLADNLVPAAGYPITVTAVDHTGNESSGATITAVVLVPPEEANGE